MLLADYQAYVECQQRVSAQSQRRVAPHGLLVEPPVWYVLAHDVDKGAAHVPNGPPCA